MFREQLQEIMLATNYSKELLADETGTCVATIDRWLSGRSTPYPAIQKIVYNILCQKN